MSEERLQKILARAGMASRRKAEEMIREGLVTINGKMAEIGDKADPERDAIKVDGKRVHPGHPHLYLLLNKPKGVVSTLADPEGRPTVLDFVPPHLRKAVVPVGRLDFATEGLLLLTDDGDFAQRVSHPRYGCRKAYEVKVKGRPPQELLDRLRSGVVLEGKRTAPCRIEERDAPPPVRRARRKKGVAAEEKKEDNATWWVVELSEGRTRQIREMFFHIGHPVQKLRRVAIGPVRDPNLPVGALRELSEREVERLNRAARPPKKPKAAKKVLGATTAAKGTAEERPRKAATAGKKAPAAGKRAPAAGKRAPAAGKRVPAASKKPAAPTKRPASRPGTGRSTSGRSGTDRPSGRGGSSGAAKRSGSPRRGRT
ncbi:MAG TPA: pseudouridine synthase [Thermoanaerobaculia bacterium]|nr:pseudouridine synthase [Thermoanaerobaculia bacterium]